MLAPTRLSHPGASDSRARITSRGCAGESGKAANIASALPGETPMRAVVEGSTRRHVLAIIVHDAAQPPTMRMEEGKGPQLARCK